jgi:PEP-CTERM motif
MRFEPRSKMSRSTSAWWAASLRRCFAAAAACTILGAAPAMAWGATLTLDATSGGYYSSQGSFSSLSYITGNASATGNETRGFLIFDLTALSGIDVSSAVLKLENVNWNDADLRVHGVPFAAAGNFGSSFGTDSNINNFNFIGSSSTPRFAQQVLPAKTDTSPSFLELALNAAGVTDLNASASAGDSHYAFGLRVALANVEPKRVQFAFGGLSSFEAMPQRAQLVVEYASAVPEPASVALMLSGLLLVAWRRRHHQARTRPVSR